MRREDNLAQRCGSQFRVPDLFGFIHRFAFPHLAFAIFRASSDRCAAVSFAHRDRAERRWSLRMWSEIVLFMVCLPVPGRWWLAQSPPWQYG